MPRPAAPVGDPDRPDYKRSLFDRHGPAAADGVRAWAFGLMVFGISVTGWMLAGGGFSVRVLLVAALAGAVTAVLSLGLANVVGGTWQRLMFDGSSTPYVEQYSYQQALVMQGRIDEALESYEAVIAEQPSAADVRIKAAELYLSSKKDHVRAAALLRDVTRIATVTPGEYIYASNRLVDLCMGPLNDPGRALVELRKLIDRYPDTSAAQHARSALAQLKSRIDIQR